MLFRAILAAALLALPLHASSVPAPPEKCPQNYGPCGDDCIPLDRTCCKLLASWGAAYGPCPKEWRCSASSGDCHPPSLPGAQHRKRPISADCPDGFAPCGSKCIASEDMCCSNGASCPAGLVCAPPPLQCAEPVETKSTTTEVDEEEPTSSARGALLTPGDLELPTTKPDYPLPSPEHTSPRGEGSTKGELSCPVSTAEREADDKSDSETRPEPSSVPSHATTEETSADQTTIVVTVDPSDGPADSATETETEAPEESRPAEEDGGARADSKAWKWVAPAVAALLLI